MNKSGFSSAILEKTVSLLAVQAHPAVAMEKLKRAFACGLVVNDPLVIALPLAVFV
jgi:hypothetical protein